MGREPVRGRRTRSRAPVAGYSGGWGPFQPTPQYTEAGWIALHRPSSLPGTLTPTYADPAQGQAAFRANWLARWNPPVRGWSA